MKILASFFLKIDSKLQNLNPKFTIPLGALAGFLIGIIARLWMHWISTDPEFSWSGSIFIVIALTLFFTVHSIVFFAVRKGWSSRSILFIRIGAIVFSLPIFGGAGSIMLPTVVAGSLAIWRKSLPKWLRILFGISSFVIPGSIVKDIGNDFGWGVATLGRVLLFIFIYGAVIAMTRSTVVKSPGAKQMSRQCCRFS